MKKLVVLLAAVTLSAGAVFAQPTRGFENHPKAYTNSEQNMNQSQNPGKLLGIVDGTTQNSITFIDMDGRKVTVTTTPFTEIQDIERLERVDPKAKDAREQYKRTFLALSQLHRGYWVDIDAFRTDGGKLVAEYIKVIRVSPNGGDK